MSNPTTELDLLSLLGNRELYHKYRGYIKEYTVLEQTHKIISDMEGYLVSYPEVEQVDWSAFSTWFCVLKNSRMKADTLELYKAIFDKLASHKPSTLEADIINRFITLEHAARLRELAQEVINGSGKGTVEDAEGILADYRGAIGSHGTTVTKTPICTTDINALLSTAGRVGGFEWRLEDLNVSVGPLHYGDMVTIGARPETGKTSFICSEGSHIVSQFDDDVDGIIFNNEEAGERIQLRLIECATGLNIAGIEYDPPRAQASYVSILKRSDRIRVYHSHAISTKDVEAELRRRKYGWIAFNRLDKIHGFHKEGNETERLNKIFQWARGLAIRGSIVFGVVQADASAEGQRWIHMDQIYNSKTGAQAESDVQLMIGKEHDVTLADKRFINIVKNKTPGGPRTDPKLKHGSLEVGFNGENGRYVSLIYK